jgi:hypothetical protein
MTTERAVLDDPMLNPMRWRFVLYLRLAGALALLTMLLAFLAAYFSDTAMIIAVVVVGGALVLAYGCGALIARHGIADVDRQLDEFRRGEGLIVWHCSPDEWRRFADVERERLGKDESAVQQIMVAVFAGIGLLVGAFAEGLLGAMIGGAVGAVLGLAYDWASGWWPRYTAWRRYRYARTGGGPTCIGRRGVFAYGEFHHWDSVWGGLCLADLVPSDPSYLHLVFAQPVADATVPGATVDAPFDVCIPVPPGREDEARTIAGLLAGTSSDDDKRRATEARVHSSDPRTS